MERYFEVSAVVDVRCGGTKKFGFRLALDNNKYKL